MATVRYMVHEVDPAVKFYTEMLGFTLEEQWGPAFAIVTKDDLKLWLSGPAASAARPMPDGRQPQPGGWNRLVIQVENLANVVEKMRASGINFRNDIVTGPGGKQILADDPSGNPIEIFEPA
jgi:catechol 2,3-dioxygenase-like lactoylglutathione lyase family enzyme